MTVAKIMESVIRIKKYETQQEVVARLNSFNAWGQISETEYNDLMLLAENAYNPPVVEPEGVPGETLPTEEIPQV